mmetsp:Transcript_102384/g.330228  ORF Transcript_102384/g.330228 Transcript_102384/m.330228 type:complete len:290 (-) Transcript_102384:655-1524(-)
MALGTRFLRAAMRRPQAVAIRAARSSRGAGGVRNTNSPLPLTIPACPPSPQPCNCRALGLLFGGNRGSRAGSTTPAGRPATLIRPRRKHPRGSRKSAARSSPAAPPPPLEMSLCAEPPRCSSCWPRGKWSKQSIAATPFPWPARKPSAGPRSGRGQRAGHAWHKRGTPPRAGKQPRIRPLALLPRSAPQAQPLWPAPLAPQGWLPPEPLLLKTALPVRWWVQAMRMQPAPRSQPLRGCRQSTRGTAPRPGHARWHMHPSSRRARTGQRIECGSCSLRSLCRRYKLCRSP